ncbi:MAG: ATP-binding protein [Acidobacteria bacterium]|nr:ATP-binding protein [Acidobacteriota bacterium]
MHDFEKLGLFYLGREYDLEKREILETPILYDARDLVTHAVCVGMTGSGKTGLCISLIEEAAIDGVPVIAIDPKGDLGNLLLTFPRLAPADFRPWVDEDEARRAGLDGDAFAAQQAQAWTEGLAQWGQDGERIERLRRAADVALYTPGSRAGLPVSVLSSFAAPPAAVREDGELMGERAGTTATSLLSLAGVGAPLRSREHTLVTMILTLAWTDGRDLDLALLIQQVQSPPFQRVGVVDLEAFFPARDRFDLAMRFNAVLAAPGFEQWFEGTPLDPSALLYTADGRPRVSVFSIAHLGDAERMFFVTLLLTQVVGWMRGQSGTSSLRAVVYMDEIAGYFPPVANPPSKAPLLTLLKQGRAFGVGVVLATQNPVDLDYKGLANAGTWLLGRLQTERDKARVLDGLQGAAAGALERSEADRILSALGKRVFLLHNVHDKGPVVFHSRWALSYLRGPLTREQIRSLTQERPSEPPSAAPVDAFQGTASSLATLPSRPLAEQRPVLPPGIAQYFVPQASDGPHVVYTPLVVGAARVTVSDAKLGVDSARDVLYATPVSDGPVPLDWTQATLLETPVADLLQQPEAPDAEYLPVPAPAAQLKSYAVWSKSFAAWLAQSEKVELLRHAATRSISRPGETERDFRIRVQEASRAARDEQVDAVRRKYASRQATLTERLRRAEAAVHRESHQASQQRMQTTISLGATVLGALFGRKAVSAGTIGRATTTARGMGRTMKETADVQRAEDTVAAARQQIVALDAELADETHAIAARFDAELTFDRVTIAPKRGQVAVQFVALAWAPD